MSSLCVITPTISRSTLKRALRSATLQEGDEWIVFGDGPQPDAHRLIKRLKSEMPYLTYIETDRCINDNGNTLRNLAMAISDKDYFLFLDDDDIFLPGAIETVRKSMNDLPVMFRMKHPNGIMWHEPIVTPGNVGGSILCVPNVRGKYGNWPGFDDSHTSDIAFIEQTAKGFGDLIWSGEIIIEVAPNDV